MIKPGSIVGQKYEIKNLIAEGGMAEIYLAQDLGASSGFCNYVAIKRLLPNIYNLSSRECFLREAYYLTNIKSAFIIRGIELISYEDEFLFVMEYISGCDLGHLMPIIHKQNLETRIKIALVIAQAISKALQCIGSWPGSDGKYLNLVHQDISPQNIIISDDGFVKLADFGSAVNAQESLGQKIVCATKRYMSPEQRAGRGLSQASDIYSLALILEEIVGADIYKTKLSAVILKAKALDLKQRYSNADEFLRDLENRDLDFKIGEHQLFLCEFLDEEFLETKNFKLNMRLKVALLAAALMLVVVLISAGGKYYFYPSIPELSLEDGHCGSYSEVLTKSANLWRR